MVNLWSPDPRQGHCDSEVGPISSSSLAAIAGSSSDSESEDLANNGYELLPMNPVEDVDLDSDGEGEVSNADLQTHTLAITTEVSNCQDLEINQEERVCSSCDNGSNTFQRQEMDPELMEQVKMAMSGFSLPLTAVPSWAFLVPEQEWRSHLVERMQCIQRGSKPFQSNHSSATDNIMTSQNGS